MKKYWHVISIGIQNTLVYRVNFLFRSLFALVPLLTTLYVWRTIYASREAGTQIAGYTLATMSSYYLVVTLVDALTAVTDDDWQIAADIKDGNISQFLVKPIDFLTYRLCLFGANRLIYSAVALVPTLLFIGWQRQYFVLPADFVTLGCFMVSLVFTALLQFFLSYTMALLAFWVLDVSAFILMLYALEFLAGGHVFPINLLPPALAHALMLTPFPYQLFFPVSIYLGQVSGTALWQGLAMQLFWVVASYGLARWIWHRGIRKYAAVGG